MFGQLLKCLRQFDLVPAFNEQGKRRCERKIVLDRAIRALKTCSRKSKHQPVSGCGPELEAPP